MQTISIKKTGAVRRLMLAMAMAVVMGILPARAQEDYRFDIGAGIGTTGYLGDANSANLMKNPGFDFEVLLRYIASPRWGFKTNFYAGSLRGNSAQMDNVLPEMAEYKFSTTFFELGEVAEFNFFNYGMGERYRHLKRWSPYIAGGLSFAVFAVDGKAHFSPVIPLGAGIKYKVNERLNLGVEFLMKKTFTDKADGENLSDPYLIKSSFAKNTDWYSTLTFTISYEFSKRCAVCHYKE